MKLTMSLGLACIATLSSLGWSANAATTPSGKATVQVVDKITIEQFGGLLVSAGVKDAELKQLSPDVVALIFSVDGIRVIALSNCKGNAACSQFVLNHVFSGQHALEKVNLVNKLQSVLPLSMDASDEPGKFYYLAARHIEFSGGVTPQNVIENVKLFLQVLVEIKDFLDTRTITMTIPSERKNDLKSELLAFDVTKSSRLLQSLQNAHQLPAQPNMLEVNPASRLQ